MRYFSGLVSKKESCVVTKAYVFVLILCFNLCIMFGASCTISEKETQGTETENPALEYQAEDLNNVLPQRIDISTTFDSVGLGTNQLNYYYTISNITEKVFLERELHDSLYTEAVGRIPCTLWRPDYMQGVEVTFNYYSSEGEQLLHFTTQQELSFDGVNYSSSCKAN